jgi:hypothetical protein
MRFDLAHPSLARCGILSRQGMFEAFDHSLVMPLGPERRESRWPAGQCWRA